MEYIGICPASCGELIQGKTEEGEFLTSYNIPLYSKACLRRGEPKLKMRRYEKSYQALERVLRYFGEEKHLSSLNLSIISNIPRGKGMSSSSADIGAVIGAAAAYLGLAVEPELAAKFAASIEPTDSIFFRRLTLIDPLSGRKIRTIGKLKGKKVLVLESAAKVETIGMRKRPEYLEYKNKNIIFYKKILEDLEEGIKENDSKLVGNSLRKSAVLNQQLLEKPRLEEIFEIADRLKAYGVNIAHSGCVVGILIDEEEDSRRFSEAFSSAKITREYGRIFCLPIIEGGIQSWRECKNGVYKKSVSDRRREF
ncbi:MAG: cobalamin biosynthesis protein [Peptostreptococcaceae bacterium]|nr:cobalamin biosynthesis protein [Peptostreptococcaceae bacterium]